MKQIGVFMLCFCLSAAATAPLALAEGMSNYELTRRIKALEETHGFGAIVSGCVDRIALSGLLEAEAGYTTFDYAAPGMADKDASDAALATLALGVDVTINDYVSGHLIWLWEEDETEPAELEEGWIQLAGGKKCPGYLAVGKMYVPFGSFESHMISDPLTLELGEARESAIQVGADLNGVYGAVYLFNGDIDEAGQDSHLDNFGANAGFAVQSRSVRLDAGISYINHILDADGWEDYIDAVGTQAVPEDVALEEYVAGLGAHAVLSVGPLALITEYVAALDEPEFVRHDGTAVSKGDQLSAWNAELACFFDFLGKRANAGLAWQGAANAGGFLPESRLMGTIGIELCEATHLALEYSREDYENSDQADCVAAQLAVAF